MSCSDADSADAALVTAATGPQSVTSDGLTVQQHPLQDLIAAANYLRSKCAANASGFGLRFRKLTPPGAVDRNQPLT